MILILIKNSFLAAKIWFWIERTKLRTPREENTTIWEWRPCTFNFSSHILTKLGEAVRKTDKTFPLIFSFCLNFRKVIIYCQILVAWQEII